MLSNEDRNKISSIIKKGTSAREISRAHALNLRDKGYTVIEVSDILEITPRTVINITTNYADGGLDQAIKDDPRTGAPIKFDERTKSIIVALVCSNPPEGFDRWTLELIKEYSEKQGIVDSIGLETVRMILQEHDLKPWQEKMWCIPKLDEEFITRMEDVLDVYEKEYDPKFPVICLDEKPIALFADKRDPILMEPGSPLKRDYEYERNGTANVFCAVEPLVGSYLNKVTENRKACEFAKFILSIENKYSDATKITLVMDNLNIHFKSSLISFYGEEEGNRLWNRFDVHYTPKHGSWLNQAEIAIGMYSRQCLGKSRIGDIDTLRKKTKAWNKIINKKQVTIKWKFTKEKAKEKFSY
ncbi:MAG: IS630 family transposase [Oligoflexia bacterium]|nr:IS630 family transposase [Oligoflexia bacterium]